MIVGLIILAIFAVAALSPAGSRAESSSSWYKATVTNAVDEEYEGETAYLVTFVTEAGTVYSYYDDSKLPEGTEIEARIDDNGKVLDAVTKAETETQMIIVYVLIGILILCIVISIADGTF